MRKTVCLFVTLAILAGCRSDELDSQLVGDWLWAGSSGGFAGMIIMPAANERTIISFTRKGTFSVSKNDTLQTSGAYRLNSVKSIYKSGEATGILIDNVVNHQRKLPSFSLSSLKVIVSMTAAELSVGDNAYDGFSSTFKRLK